MNKYFFPTIFITLVCGFFCYLITACAVYGEANFDSINFLYWNYGAMSGHVPYRDFFYPYGLVQYYLYSHTLAAFLYALVLSTISISIGIYLKSLFRNIFYFLLSSAFVIYFLLNYVSIETFGRYGSFVFLGILMGYLILIKKRTLKNEFLAGLSCGIMLSLFFDQGVYGVLIYVILSLVSIYSNLDKKDLGRNIKVFSYRMLLFGLAFCLGAMPFIIYLYIHDGLLGFIESTKFLAGVSKYAKVPFFPSLKNPDGIFVTVSIIISTILLLLKAADKKIQKEEKMLFILTLVMLILQYKNTVRPFFSQLTFISLLMFVNSIAIVIRDLKTSSYIHTKFFFVIVVIMLFFFPFPKPTFFKIVHNSDYVLNGGAVCYAKNTHKIYSEFDSIKSSIVGNVYSYPANPLIYAYLHQKLPYFLTIYETTSDEAQEKSIQYIKDNNIQTILFDPTSEAIQDGVPDVLRANTLLSYMLSNFTIKMQKDKYFILERNEESDFFTHIPDEKESIDFVNRFLNIPMGTIPLSEGKRFKNISASTWKGKVLVQGGLAKVNQYISKNSVFGKQVLIILKLRDINSDMGMLDLYSNIKKTTVEFNLKKGYPWYFFNVSRVPLFFKDRKIEKMNFKGDAEITILQKPIDHKFW